MFVLLWFGPAVVALVAAAGFFLIADARMHRARADLETARKFRDEGAAFVARLRFCGHVNDYRDGLIEVLADESLSRYPAQGQQVFIYVEPIAPTTIAGA